MDLAKFHEICQRIDGLTLEQLESLYEMIAREANAVMGGSYALLSPFTTDTQSLGEIALRCLDMGHMKQATPERLRQRARLALSNLYMATIMAPEHIGAWQRIMGALEEMSSPRAESKLEKLRAKANRGEQAEAHLRALLADVELGLIYYQDHQNVFAYICLGCRGRGWPHHKNGFPHSEDCTLGQARKWLAEQEGRKVEQEEVNRGE